MIISFSDKATEDLFNGSRTSKALKFSPQLVSGAIRKLDMLNAAEDLRDLRVPPGNRLEELRGKLRGYHSIRINDQYRIVFKWKDKNAHDVEISDYH